MKHAIFLTSTVLILVIPNTLNAQPDERFRGIALELQMEQKYATKLPIVFACRVQNQSKEASPSLTITPWPPFIAGYKFRIQVCSDMGDLLQTMSVSNQLTLLLSGNIEVRFPPGENRTVPLAIPALPAGKYKLLLEGKHSAAFEVADSAELRHGCIKKYLDGYWSGDEFFSHVLRMTARESGHRDVYKEVEEKVAKALGSDDLKKATVAAKFLSFILKPCQPEIIEKHLAEAVALRCQDNDLHSAGKWYPYLSASCDLASKLGSDKALSVVLEILNRKPPIGDNGYPSVRAAAAFALQSFKQDKAAEELVRIASRSSPIAGEQMVIYQAAHALCVRKDQRSLGVLFKLYHDDEFRGYKGKILFSATALYENPGVDEFIKSATNDPDPVVRGDAQSALRRLNIMRENHRKK